MLHYNWLANMAHTFVSGPLIQLTHESAILFLTVPGPLHSLDQRGEGLLVEKGAFKPEGKAL